MGNQYTQPWTYDHDELILNLVGTMSFNAIGNKIGRTPGAVERRLERLGSIGTKSAMGSFSARELSLALHVDYKVLYRWMEEHKLPLRARNLTTVRQRTNKTYFINAEDFWAWAERHKDLVNFARIEPDILLPEPYWLEAERAKCNAKTGSIWTDEEDELLWQLYYGKGMLQSEVALQIGRSVSSIEKRLARLRAVKKAVLT